MRYGDFLGSLSLASSHSGGFPYSVEHMAAQVKVNRLKPRAPILYAYTEHAQFVNVSYFEFMAAYSWWTLDVVSKFFITSPV